MTNSIGPLTQKINSATPGECIDRLCTVSFHVDPLQGAALQLLDRDTGALLGMNIIDGTWNLFGIDRTMDFPTSLIGCGLPMPAKSPLNLRVRLINIYQTVTKDLPYPIVVPPLGFYALRASPTNGVAPLTVQFAVSVRGGFPPYSISWDFGDGSPPAQGSSVSYIYRVAGNFGPTVTITDSRGIKMTGVVNPQITVTPPPPPRRPGQFEIVVRQTSGQPAVGANVVVDKPGWLLDFGHLYYPGTTDLQGAVYFSLGPVLDQGTAQVTVNWRDSGGSPWYAKGEVSFDPFGFVNPDQLTLVLTPGTVNQPGPPGTLGTFSLGDIFSGIGLGIPWYVWIILAGGSVILIGGVAYMVYRDASGRPLTFVTPLLEAGSEIQRSRRPRG